MYHQSPALVIRDASLNEVESIRDIATETWPIAYGKILAPQQLGYMLQLIYSIHSLEEQMKNQHHFFMALLNDVPVGFASFSHIEEQVYKLQKLYVLPTVQKTGAGKKLLNKVETTTKSMGATMLILNVNRMNVAISFYKRNGYEIIREEDIGIGSGYYMNDYVMAKSLA